MKKFFLDSALVRIFIPLISGTILYMLILTLFNDIDVLLDNFISNELYFCIFLALITQEMSLALFKSPLAYDLKNNLFLIPLNLFLIALVVAFLLKVYFKYLIGYSPATVEYLIFTSVYSLLSLFFIAIKVSYNYLHKKNLTEINKEQALKTDIENEFLQFKSGINPKLLFSSLESLIILGHKDKREADNLIDQLSIVYRYILSNRKHELIDCSEEIEIAHELVNLFNHLPYASIRFSCDSGINTLIVPGTLLHLIELIIKKSIKTNLSETQIYLKSEDNNLILEFKYQAKLGDELKSIDFNLLNKSYSFYTDESIQLDVLNNQNNISVPKLSLGNVQINT